jgi:AcrR family transcriptional regulator
VRVLFAERGHASVGTEEIVQAAGVTRGALYYQHRDKAALFATVAETVQAEIAHRITTRSADRRRHRPAGRAACRGSGASWRCAPTQRSNGSSC